MPRESLGFDPRSTGKRTKDKARDLKAETEASLSKAAEIARTNRLKEVKATADTLDSEYWVALCFETREQKEEFLRLFKLEPEGDKYLDGGAVAKRLGKPLQSPGLPGRKMRTGARWLPFSRE